MSTPPPADHVPGAPSLIWTEQGEPRSAQFGDVYFSADDGLAETRAVFLQGCGLPEAWADKTHFTVAELGFGTGLNIAALLDLWRRHRPANGHLNIFSIEAYPLSAAEAARALANWPELAETAAALTAAWPATTPSFHRIDLPDLNASFDLAIGDVRWALSQWRGRADAWFLDGFSPALNPDMWAPDVLALIAARSAPQARLATFTVAGAVRRGLTELGFQVDKRPGHGRKRERLEARLDAPLEAAPTPFKRIAILGAGIAGASAARALKASGAEVVVIEAEAPGAGASGFPAALVTPRLDAGDALIAGLHAQALERARDLYRAVPPSSLPGAILREGVLQLEQAERDQRRFARVAEQPVWPTGAMTTADSDKSSAHVGEPVDVGGLMMADALTLNPRAVLDAWLADIPVITARAARLDPTDTGWRILDAEGQGLTEADAVIVTAGWGAAALLPEFWPDLPLRPVRGQADWCANTPPPAAIAWGGYVAPTGDGFLYGATHDRDDTATEVRSVDTERNLHTLAARLPGLAKTAASASGEARAAIRATTPDRLPFCGPLKSAPGLYMLGGLGSRGFCLAPLLGEHLAALILDRPSPLPADYAARLSPYRA